jgi:hypothetical protein
MVKGPNRIGIQTMPQRDISVQLARWSARRRPADSNHRRQWAHHHTWNDAISSRRSAVQRRRARYHPELDMAASDNSIGAVIGLLVHLQTSSGRILA